ELGTQEGQEEKARQTVSAAAEQASRLRRQARWQEGRDVLAQAERQLDPSMPAELRQRLGHARVDLDVAARLDAVRLERANVVESKFDNAGAERQYQA